MEPEPEIKRVFPKCWKCGTSLPQCYCAASRNEREALEEYMAIRDQLADLEGRELECKCGDFFTCDLCRESSDKTHQLRGLMDLWGDTWITRLASVEGVLATDGIVGAQREWLSSDTRKKP